MTALTHSPFSISVPLTYDFRVAKIVRECFAIFTRENLNEKINISGR